MKLHLLAAAVVVTSGTLLVAQEEKKVPKDSARVTLQGCAKGRTFIVGPRSEHGSSNLNIEPGRRFQLNGPKKVLAAIKEVEAHTVEVTGLVRKADLEPQGGLTFAGGRVRIGGADPREPVGGAAGNSGYSQPVMDVESSRSLGGTCPQK
jgi:hypothetical protein